MGQTVSVFQSVSNAVGNIYTADQIQMIQNTVAKNTSPQELAFFLSLCDRKGLDPFNKEIWCYKDGQKNLVMFTGRDGFLKMAQNHPNFAGMRSCEVRENDIFEVNVATGIIDHRVDFKERGKVIGAYAIIFKVKGETVIELASFETYYKGKKRDGGLINSSPWNTTPEEMIKKIAESHGLKKAFGFSGLQSEDDNHDIIEEPLSPENDITPKEVIPEPEFDSRELDIQAANEANKVSEDELPY